MKNFYGLLATFSLTCQLVRHKKTNYLLIFPILLLHGCSTVVTYNPQTTNEQQTVSYSQGIGAVSEKSGHHEIAIYPTFRTQGTDRPTFNMSYANNSEQSIQFGIENISAYFRGEPVKIYSFESRIAEIQLQKRTKQVVLAVLGGIAAGAAAYGASHQTYRQNYSGSVWNNRGYVTGFNGSNTIRTYDPLSGIIVGGAVAGATAYGVNQLEYSAQAEEEAASSILQTNTVNPQQVVSGQIILQDCCDQFTKATDVIRIDIKVNGTTNTFEFARTVYGQPSSTLTTINTEQNKNLETSLTQPQTPNKTTVASSGNRVTFLYEPIGLYQESNQGAERLRLLTKDTHGVVKHTYGDWLLVEVNDPLASHKKIEGWVLKNMTQNKD